MGEELPQKMLAEQKQKRKALIISRSELLDLGFMCGLEK